MSERPAQPRQLDIELLALDLNTCSRCTGTEDHVLEAIGLTRPVLDAVGMTVQLRRIVVDSEAAAKKHRFVASPTVRIQGRDIAPEIVESACSDCTELCGCDGNVSCRIWRHRGEEFTAAPVGLIVESILREAFGERSETAAEKFRGVPENLRRFFQATAQACCSVQEQESCCEQGEKDACCDASQPQTCGCR